MQNIKKKIFIFIFNIFSFNTVKLVKRHVVYMRKGVRDVKILLSTGFKFKKIKINNNISSEN